MTVKSVQRGICFRKGLNYFSSCSSCKGGMEAKKSGLQRGSLKCLEDYGKVLQIIIMQMTVRALKVPNLVKL